MNTVRKILGLGALGLVTAGCSASLSMIDSKLPKYDTNGTWYIEDPEASLMIENEFDTNPKDGKLNGDKTNYKDSRRALLDALLQMRKEGKEKLEKSEKPKGR